MDQRWTCIFKSANVVQRIPAKIVVKMTPLVSFIPLIQWIIVWFLTLCFAQNEFDYIFDWIARIWTALFCCTVVHTQGKRPLVVIYNKASLPWICYFRTKLMDLKQSIWEQFKWNCVQNNFILNSTTIRVYFIFVDCFAFIPRNYVDTENGRERETWPIHFMMLNLWLNTFSPTGRFTKIIIINYDYCLLFVFFFKFNTLRHGKNEIIVIMIIVATEESTRPRGHTNEMREMNGEYTKLNNQTNSPVLLLLVDNKMKF